MTGTLITGMGMKLPAPPDPRKYRVVGAGSGMIGLIPEWNLVESCQGRDGIADQVVGIFYNRDLADECLKILNKET